MWQVISLEQAIFQRDIKYLREIFNISLNRQVISAPA